MLDLTHLAVRSSDAGRTQLCGRWHWLIVALVAAVGCRAGVYSSGSLPAELHAPPTSNVDQINLANMSGLGTASSLIGPDDLVEITITSGGEQSKVEPILARVAENGNVNVPLVGEVPIVGIEPYEAGERIAAASVERGIFRQPVVVVKVDEPAMNRVTVMGAVEKPGVQKLPRGSSDVVNAVASAGGFTKNASTEVDIMRQSGPSFMASKSTNHDVVQASYNETMDASAPRRSDANIADNSRATTTSQQPYRLNLAQANPSRQADYHLGDGDVVMVLPEKERVIHVSGLVNKPNQFKIPRNQDVYLLDAIAMAGGIKSPVADKVYVIRRQKDKPEPAIIQLSIAEAKKNGEENLRLTSGDMVSVEATPTTYFVDTVSTFFRVGLGLGGSIAAF